MTKIKQIINSIKDITNDGTSPVNIINFGGIMKSNFYFHNPISKKRFEPFKSKRIS